MEKAIERVLFASRWLMAPFYLGLIAALLMLMVKFVQEVVHYFPMVLSLSESDVVLVALSLIDLSLAASLVLMVILSGYENFVSKIDVGEEEDRPIWMGTLDFGGLKLKLISSIVAISGISLLRNFMDVASTPKEDLMWLAIVHVVFVVSGVLLALMDWLSAKTKQIAKAK